MTHRAAPYFAVPAQAALEKELSDAKDKAVAEHAALEAEHAALEREHEAAAAAQHQAEQLREVGLHLRSRAAHCFPKRTSVLALK